MPSYRGHFNLASCSLPKLDTHIREGAQNSPKIPGVVSDIQRREGCLPGRGHFGGNPLHADADPGAPGQRVGLHGRSQVLLLRQVSQPAFWNNFSHFETLSGYIT